MRGVLFDFDGTLMDTWPGIETVLRATLRDLGMTHRERHISRGLVGMGLAKAFQELLGGGEDLGEMAAERYRELFPEIGMPHARPYEGVVPLLGTLRGKGVALYVVTARNEVITRRMLSDHGLDTCFTFVRGEKEGEKPDGKGPMVAEVLERFSLPPGQCVMVGDRRYDMEAALANGLGAIGVTYGYGSREELQESGAGTLVDSVKELEEILAGGL